MKAPFNLNKTQSQFLDPRHGGASFRLQNLDGEALRTPARVNFFTIFWIREGAGRLHIDSHEYGFKGPVLLFANPYQTLFFDSPASISAVRLDFHANFFCIETYHEEVGCNGVLFNDIYGAPVLPVAQQRADEFESLIAQMQNELRAAGLAHSEILLSYLKVLLITATRLKLQRQQCAPAGNRSTPDILGRLIEAVEIHFREKHKPSDYASLLGISEKALNKAVRTHSGKTLTVLIRERILKHAKWHMLHTRKPVKEIAAELGFADEFYFSRLFKRSTGMAPSAFRDYETAIRGGRNLSRQPS